MKERIVGSVVVLVIFALMAFLPPVGTRIVTIGCLIIAYLEIALVVECVGDVDLLIWPKIEKIVLFLAVLVVFVHLLTKSDLVFVAAACALADVGGFVAGLLCRGNGHKVRPLAKISPKKTYEGYIGMILVGIIIGVIFIKLGWVASSWVAWSFTLLSGVIAGIGDLMGSACKRALGVKDSREALINVPIIGTVEKALGGHGGFLDRFDSISLGIVLYGLGNFIAML